MLTDQVLKALAGVLSAAEEARYRAKRYDRNPVCIAVSHAAGFQLRSSVT